MRALAILILLGGTAAAQPVTDTSVSPAPAPARDGRKFTVMWAPLRALFGLAEFTVEYRLADKLGVSLELGAGRRTVDFDAMTSVKGTELEGGAQVRYYVLGSYTHGMELGAELLDEYVTFDEPLPGNVVGVAAGGVTAGAFAGYKVATNVGFTFEAQLGARYLIVDPKVTGMGTPAIASQDKWLPLLHLNAGWTF